MLSSSHKVLRAQSFSLPNLPTTSMASTDPCEWSVAQVVDYVRHSLVNEIATLPGSVTFDANQVASKFEACEVNGYALLNLINATTLREDLGLTSMSVRNGILHFLHILRERSTKFKAVKDEQAHAILAPIGSSESVADPTPRASEHFVQDASGRKRRKLNLQALTPVISEAPADKISPTVASGARKPTQNPTYLPNRVMPLDEMFYGTTRIGQQLEPDSLDDPNFITDGPIHAGLVKTISRRMMHYLKAPKEEIMYGGKAATVVYPYRERRASRKNRFKSMLSNKSQRSATVFQQQADGEVTAIRANASMLPFQQYEVSERHESIDTEYGYLLERWANVPDDKVLSDDDNQSVTSSLLEEIEAEAEETARAATRMISSKSAQEIVDQVIKTMTENWVERKQPSLERTQAWSLWRQHRGSRSRRDFLVGRAKDRIRTLQTRLDKCITEMLKEQWMSDQGLRKQCVSLEATVEDIAKENWKIAVWQRREEPEHVSKPRKNVAQSAAQRIQSVDDQDHNMHDFVVEDVPDVSVSVNEDDYLDLLHRANADEDTPRSPCSIPSSEPPDMPEIIPGTPALFGNDNVKSEIPELDSDGLPSPSVLFRSSQAAFKQPEPVDPIPFNFVNLISSDPPSPKRMTPKKTILEQSTPPRISAFERMRREEIAANPLCATQQEIRAWDYAELAAEKASEKIIIKIAFDMDSAIRKILLNYILTAKMSNVFENVQLVCSTFPEEPAIYDHQSPEKSKAMNYAARLYLCWYHELVLYWDCSAKTCGDQWSKIVHFEDWSLRKWHSILRPALQKADNKVVMIDSDDDDGDENDHVPTSARKRRVQKNKTSENLRQRALARQANFSQQSSDVVQLSRMTAGGDSTGREVVVWAPEGSDPSQHVYLNDHLAASLKPHQVEGIRFMWRELTVPDDEDGQGCILAHTMGLGKTAQTIALLVTFANAINSPDTKKLIPESIWNQRTLVVCPPTLIENWRKELEQWDPQRRLGSTFSVDSVTTSKEARLATLRKWNVNGGILIIGYRMLSTFVTGKMQRRSTGDTKVTEEVATDLNFTLAEQEQAASILLETPSIVVADEAHMLKNERSKTAQAASQFKTQRRIALTGSPMSNNTQEIYSLVSWVAPTYLGSAEEFRAHYAEPIEQGSWVESSREERRKSLKKLSALNRIISPKLSRAEITALKGSIKPKVEFVLTVPLTEIQTMAYTKFVHHLLPSNDTSAQAMLVTQAKLFGWLALLTLLCNHPWTFRQKLLEDPKSAKRRKSNSPVDATTVLGEGEEVAPGDEHVSALHVNDAMVSDILETLPSDEGIENSYKTQMVEKIIELSIKAGDKLLLFSHRLQSLDYFNKMLRANKTRFSRIDGGMNQQRRALTLQEFERGEYDVLLISTTAGGLGLNIQTANRVIIFDFGFNPTWEEQAIGRAYRLGQKKAVFVYRFVAGGTFESMLYNKALFKTSLASRVVDKRNPERNANKQAKDWLFVPQTVGQDDILADKGKDPMVLDKLLDGYGGVVESIRAIKTMETLQRDADDAPLTEEEQREVEEEIANLMRAKQQPLSGVPPFRYGGGGGLAEGSGPAGSV